MNVSIKNVPEDVVERLRERAQHNHRSLQGELMAILEDNSWLLSPGDVAERARARGLQTGSDSVRIIRQDRDSR